MIITERLRADCCMTIIGQVKNGTILLQLMRLGYIYLIATVKYPITTKKRKQDLKFILVE